MPGVEMVQVTMDTMTDEERRALRTGLTGGEDRPSPFEAGSRTTVIGIASGKGGVGKSSITANLAIALARTGATVGLLDADVYGYSIPRMMGVTRPAVAVDDLMMPIESHGVRMMSIGFLTEEDSPVIWRGPMLHKALTSFVTEVWWDDPDYLLVDLPPGTGDVALSLAQLLPTASFVIVTTPQLAAQRVARRAAAMAARVNLPVAGVIENMSYFVAPDTGARYEVFSGGGGQLLAAELGVPLLGRIPLEPAVAEAGDAGLPVVAAHPDSPAARALLEAARAVAAALPRPRGRALLSRVALVASRLRAVTLHSTGRPSSTTHEER